MITPMLSIFGLYLLLCVGSLRFVQASPEATPEQADDFPNKNLFVAEDKSFAILVKEAFIGELGSKNSMRMSNNHFWIPLNQDSLIAYAMELSSCSFHRGYGFGCEWRWKRSDGIEDPICHETKEMEAKSKQKPQCYQKKKAVDQSA